MNDVDKRPYRADGGDISTGRLKEIADNPYGDEEKCWLAKRVLASLEAEIHSYTFEEDPRPLYTAPPAPVVDADDNFYSWFGREWHEHYQQNQYTTAAKQMLGVMAESAWKAGRRAAMIQGAENAESRCTIQTAPVLDSLPQNADSRCSNSPVFPDGWVMVPVEPTEEMLAELCLVKGWTARALNARYQAMLAAAPKPEA